METKLQIIKGPVKGKIIVLNKPTTCIAGRSKKACFRFSDHDIYHGGILSLKLHR